MTEDIDGRIDALQNWSRKELITEWARLYKNMPSIRTGKGMMVRAIAYRWQDLSYGGLSKKDQQLLDNLARAYHRNPASLTIPLQIKNGTRLRRLWNGKVYEVSVGQEGFIYDGKKYGSLSEIARLITNTRWNGRVFFGLKSSSPKAKRGGADVQASA
jgi:hypothetical protein